MDVGQGSLAVVLCIACACTRPNPEYCDEQVPCSSGTCNFNTHLCEATDGGVRSDGQVASDGAPTACQAAGGKVVISTDRDGDYEIATMLADGSEFLRLTDDPVADLNPRFSPDGRYVAWVRAGPQAFVMNADGSDQHNVSQGDAQSDSVVWSPDSHRLLFVSTRDGNSEVYAVDADGANLRNLTSNAATDSQPDWSADGSHIVFRSNRADANYELFTMNSDGTGQVAITSRPSLTALPRWSPLNADIAWADGTPAADLWTARANGSSPHMVAAGPVDFALTWAPDGSKLAWRQALDIVTIAADGTAFVNLTNDGSTVNDNLPSWSPNSDRLIFQTRRDGDPEVYVVGADGSAPTNISNSIAMDIPGNWVRCP